MPTTSLPALEQRLEARLLDLDKLHRTRPGLPTAMARAEAGERIDDLLDAIAELQRQIDTRPAESLEDAAVGQSSGGLKKARSHSWRSIQRYWPNLRSNRSRKGEPPGPAHVVGSFFVPSPGTPDVSCRTRQQAEIGRSRRPLAK